MVVTPSSSSSSSLSFSSSLPLPEPTTRAEYLACQFSSWYPLFSRPLLRRESSRRRRPKGLTFRSQIISNLSPAFLEFLTQDGIRLPSNTKPSSCLGCRAAAAAPLKRSQKDNDDNNNSDDDDSHSTWSSSFSSSSSSSQPNPEPSNTCVVDLTDLTRDIRAAISRLGGVVVPKLNWSAPRDATWINEGQLQCRTAADVYLLLKASDFCASDIQLVVTDNNTDASTTTTTQDGTGSSTTRTVTTTTTTRTTTTTPWTQLELVLRQYVPNLYPSFEFRCFVKNHALVAISQRHADQYFAHLAKNKTTDHVTRILVEFWDEYRHLFQQHFVAAAAAAKQEKEEEEGPVVPISHYVVDVYLDTHDQVWIVDFNVWGSRTDSLLFDWNELMLLDIHNHNHNAEDDNNHKDDHWPPIRVVETDKQVRPHSLHNFRAPVDTVHLASLVNTTTTTTGNSEGFQELMKLCRQQNEQDDDDDESDDDDNDNDNDVPATKNHHPDQDPGNVST
ncbi:hypothetical protein ACA910_022678 [Epithemia clementina (nom. ined.)]